MLYDFSVMTDRRDTNSLKWDVAAGELPMWVADMDFTTAPEIISAMKDKVEKGIFGYTVVPHAWYEAIGGWWQERHGFSIRKEWLIFCTGVVPVISSIVRKMTTVGENVLIQTPVYNIFFNSIVNNGRNVVECPLEYGGGSYRIDFAALEAQLSNPQTTMMILCNPHNPVGRIWSREELERIGEMCERHHVLVVSDEIHCDLTDIGCSYIPFASVSQACEQNSITCVAPTKAFNLAGLQTAAVIVPNPVLRHKVNRGLNTDEAAEPNALAMEATVAAFRLGGPWLDELRGYIKENKERVRQFIGEELPMLSVPASEATYLLWIDCRRVTEDTALLCDVIRRETGLYLSEGAQYGASGRGFVRMNTACPRERLDDGLKRLKRGVEAFDGSVE